KKQNNPKEMLEFTHLFIKNMIIEEDFLNSIDKKDNILISYLIINLLRPSTNINYQELSDTYFPKPLLDSNTQIIFIPETNKYENIIKKNNFITLNEKNIIIPKINHLNNIKHSDNLFDIFIFLLDKYEINLKHKKEYLSNLLNYYETVKTKKKNYKW